MLMTPNKVKSLRRAYGLSLDDLGEIVGATGRTVRRWEDASVPITRSAAIIMGLIEEFPQVRRHFGLAKKLG
jgi:DNA-binding transcriptional regulator YiaG